MRVGMANETGTSNLRQMLRRDSNQRPVVVYPFETAPWFYFKVLAKPKYIKIYIPGAAKLLTVTLSFNIS